MNGIYIIVCEHVDMGLVILDAPSSFKCAPLSC